MIINLNGDTEKTLTEQIGEFGIQLGYLELAVGKCAPHGRNYPGQLAAGGQFDTDRRAFVAAQTHIKLLNEYYNYLCVQLSAALD